jgi:hypothetical protein
MKMKNVSSMKSRNAGIGLASMVAMIGSLFTANAQVESWTATSGLTPTQSSSNWVYRGDSLSVTPTIYGHFMLMDTKLNRRLSYFETKPGSLSLPSNLTIEFSTRFYNRNATINNVSSSALYFGLGNGLGSVVYFGVDDVWFGGPGNTRGAGISTDTDNDFHKYRLEVNGLSLGSQINLYYDDSASPLLTSLVYYDPTFYGNTERIGFGDITKHDSGVSKWSYLWHNAGNLPIQVVPEPTTAAMLIAGGAILLARRNRKSQK